MNEYYSKQQGDAVYVLKMKDLLNINGRETEAGTILLKRGGVFYGVNFQERLDDEMQELLEDGLKKGMLELKKLDIDDKGN